MASLRSAPRGSRGVPSGLATVDPRRFVVVVAAVASACVASTDEVSDFGKVCESDEDCGSGFVCDDKQTICVEDGQETQNEARIIAAFCAQREACDTPTTDCVAVFQAQANNAASQGSDTCAQMHDAQIAFMACEVDEPCATFEQGGECPEEAATFFGLQSGGAAPCLEGNPPGPPVPAGWRCPASFFGGGDGCDCGCEVDDPDCDGQGCAAASCNEDATCDFCYDAGGQQAGTPNGACS